MWEHFKDSQTKCNKKSAEGHNTLLAVKLKLRLFSIVHVLQLTLQALGFFLLAQHWGGGVFSTSLCKVRSRHSRKLKFTGMIVYVMF